MPIAIEVLVLLVVAAVFRNEIADLVGGVCDYAIADVFPIIIRALIVIAVVWFLITATIIFTGIYANSKGCAVVISILLPLWFAATVFSFADKYKVFGPVVKMLRSKFIAGTIIVATAGLLFGVWSPDAKASFNNWQSAKQKTITMAMERSAELGSIGKLNSISVAYNSGGVILDREGKEPMRFKPGTRVKFLERKAPQGMIWVQLENQFGDFVTGNNEVMFPIDKVDL
ncbi:MAG TPA: hypothetical protein P5548_02100 [Candidatus Moranbacteria bacterium]|nr:hypothetical protein [Candidatus Moranbacteria bacterium]HRZ33665.1 hypothetical protein [Candidatus Moranbacteria bacterium]